MAETAGQKRGWSDYSIWSSRNNQPFRDGAYLRPYLFSEAPVSRTGREKSFIRGDLESCLSTEAGVPPDGGPSSGVKGFIE